MEFKKMIGYDFEYQIYADGTILKNVNNEFKKLKFYDNGIGYKMVSLKINKKYKLHYVHRLVAFYFVDNPNLYLEVNHLDFDKSNNSYLNLEWCNRVHNIRHYHSAKPVKNYFVKKIKNFCYIKQMYSIDFYKYNKKWRLRVKIDGKRKHIGYFKTYEEALYQGKNVYL